MNIFAHGFIFSQKTKKTNKVDNSWEVSALFFFKLIMFYRTAIIYFQIFNQSFKNYMYNIHRIVFVLFPTKINVGTKNEWSLLEQPIHLKSWHRLWCIFKRCTFSLHSATKQSVHTWHCEISAILKMFHGPIHFSTVFFLLETLAFVVFLLASG